MNLKHLLYGFILCAILFPWNGFTAQAATLPAANDFQIDEHHPWVDSVFNALTLDERIAQLFMVAAYSNRDEAHVKEIGNLIREYHIGSLIFFQGGPVRQAKQTNYYQSLSKIPLLIAIDGEWGLAMRLDSVPLFPRQMMMGALPYDDVIYRFGQEIGREWQRMGIHVNFAPVVDINSNPKNPVINNRAFGDKKEEVARQALAYMNGMQSMHILTSAKHFPGHGDTQTDSHYALPLIQHTYARIDSIDFFPYRRLIAEHLSGVMVSHLNVPHLDPAKNSIASVSKRIVTDILRDSLHFNGLVYTDALNMKGLSESYGPGAAEVAAIKAGVDVLVMPEDVPLALRKIKEAIASGKLSEEAINTSCKRILYAKVWSGAYRTQPIETQHLVEDLNGAAAKTMAREIVENSITLLQNKNDILPLKNLENTQTAIVLQGVSSSNTFLRTLLKYREADVFYFNRDGTADDIQKLLTKLQKYDLVITGIHDTNYRPASGYGVTSQTVQFTDRLADSTRVVMAFFGIPYGLSAFQHLDRYEAILLGYQDQVLVQDYTAQIIYGAVAAQGKLPVDLPHFPQGTGLLTQGGLRLKYSIPEALHANLQTLHKVDSLVTLCIQNHIMPGCQIVAAKEGVVYFDKCYGSFTYDSTHMVESSDLYDLASVTKIAATVPALMALDEAGQIRMTQRVSAYLPELDTTNKKNLTFLEILSHYARLQPFINFYFSTLTTPDPEAPLYKTQSDEFYTIPLSKNAFLHREVALKTGYFAAKPDSLHTTEVAHHLYIRSDFRDTIFKAINASELLPTKAYKYSDLGYYYIWRVIEKISQEKMQDYLQRTLYRPLGASSMGYLPLQRFKSERIAPTENDTYFRGQLLQGHVHDQGAALLGGVCGHAGLFANANDLAKLMQMYLNGGSYGGEQYFKPSTLDYYTSAHFNPQNNRRGVGFDRPLPKYDKLGPVCEAVSQHSFGHSGFTGSYTWADPDNGILYVFLTNRIYPNDIENNLAKLDIRTQIHQWIIESIL